MSIWIIDTSVLCNILDIPGRNQQRQQVVEEFRRPGFVKDVILLLPFVSILETGNHIAQLSDGRRRYQFAARFVEEVLRGLEGKTPWKATPAFPIDSLRTWIASFPEQSKRGVGFADLSIIQEWEYQKSIFPKRRIRIWSYDEHLMGYDTRDPDYTSG